MIADLEEAYGVTDASEPPQWGFYHSFESGRAQVRMDEYPDPGGYFQQRETHLQDRATYIQLYNWRLSQIKDQWKRENGVGEYSSPQNRHGNQSIPVREDHPNISWITVDLN